jgi:uncharacterized membrane protein (DUF4010 family)
MTVLTVARVSLGIAKYIQMRAAGSSRAIGTRSLTGGTMSMAENVEYLVTGAGGGIDSVSRSVVELPIRDGATV